MCSDNNSTDVTLTENPSCRYALHDVIYDLTIEELESVVGYMQDVEGVLQSSPPCSNLANLPVIPRVSGASD